MPRILSLILAFVVAGGAASAGDGKRDLLDDIRTVAKQGRGTAAGRAAWDRLAAADAALLPTLLAGMDGADAAAANWLRTAFDRILDRALAADAKGIDTDALLAFAKDQRRGGRVARPGRHYQSRRAPRVPDGLVCRRPLRRRWHERFPHRLSARNEGGS